MSTPMKSKHSFISLNTQNLIFLFQTSLKEDQVAVIIPWRLHNVASTSMHRHDVEATLYKRHLPTVKEYRLTVVCFVSLYSFFFFFFFFVMLSDCKTRSIKEVWFPTIYI